MARQVAGAAAWLEYAALAVPRSLLAALPLKSALRVGAALGAAAMRLDRFNRPVAMRNLEIAFPEADTDQRRAVLLGMYRNWGRIAAEWAHLGKLDRAGVDRLVVYEDERYLEQLVRTVGGNGILILTAHFGNFELMAAAHSLHGFPTAIVHRPLRNPLVDAAVRAARERFGVRSIQRRGAGRQIIELLRSNWMVALALDLDVRHGVFVEFFSLKACTSAALARLAMATGAPVVPGFIVRDGDRARHRIKILPPVELAVTADREEAARENTQRFTAVVEAMIRRYPDHWNWIHRRWKTRPPGEARFY